MPEAISDTGPILHLKEIGKLALLATVSPIVVPDLVMKELEARGIGPPQLRDASVEFTVSSVRVSEWQGILDTMAPQIQPADAQVFALVRESRFQVLALTDDLILRRHLEDHGTQVAGTVGVLVRAYASARISRTDLGLLVESLSSRSSLFLSRAFRSYLNNLLTRLP